MISAVLPTFTVYCASVQYIVEERRRERIVKGQFRRLCSLNKPSWATSLHAEANFENGFDLPKILISKGHISYGEKNYPEVTLQYI